ncbi:hypothetical protein ACQ4PT_022254 [Festuca glaucescens]
MAAGRHPSRLFVVAQDSSLLGNLVFNLNLKYLFSQKSQVPDEEEPPLLRSLPDPVAYFKLVNLSYEYMAFAASPDGQVIAAIGYKGQTLLYDAAAAMNHPMNHPVLLPVGDRMFFAIFGKPRVHPHRGQGRRPPTFEDLGAYFVSGTRVYVSLRTQGTYSYHTVRRRWRTEGAWELPVRGRAILVPNFLGTGRKLLFGFLDFEEPRLYDEFPLCAVDMDARPPVVVGCWPKAARFSQQLRAGYRICPRVSQLNYFGNGRFCISVTSHKSHSRDGVVCFMAVELTQELQLLKHQYSCYLISESTGRYPADVLL